MDVHANGGEIGCGRGRKHALTYTRLSLTHNTAERLVWEDAKGKAWDAVAINPTVVFGECYTKVCGEERKCPVGFLAVLVGNLRLSCDIHLGLPYRRLCMGIALRKHCDGQEQRHARGHVRVGQMFAVGLRKKRYETRSLTRPYRPFVLVTSGPHEGEHSFVAPGHLWQHHRCAFRVCQIEETCISE